MSCATAPFWPGRPSVGWQVHVWPHRWPAPPFAPLNPMGLVDPILGVTVSAPMLAAGIIALPANLGSAWAVEAVQVFVNLTVPRNGQAEVFAIQKVQNNLLRMIMIPMFGLLATRFGTAPLFVVAPLVVAGITLLLIRLSYRFVVGHAAPVGLAARFVVLAGDSGEDDDPILGRRL